MRTSFTSAIALVAATPAFADVPRVVTDIGPVHSLVSMVMDGVGEPDILLENGASPHGYTLRPSEARALQEADVVVWVGEGLTPWLAEAQSALSEGAISLSLLEQAGTKTHPFRDAIIFAEDDHDDDDDHDDHDDHHDHAHDEHKHEAHKDHDDHGHDGHDDHDNEAHKDHDDHAEHDHAEHDDHDHEKEEAAHDHDHDHDHDHGSVDPHAWLDPGNARLWLDVIATTLADTDPDNAATYRANADSWAARIEATEEGISTTLGDEAITGFAVYHDAFQYFERAFGVQTLTSLSAGDGAQPSAARAAALGDAIRAGDVSCVFSEPQFADRALRAVSGGSNTKVAVIDPLGFELEPGPTLYGELLGGIAEAIASCQ